MRVERLVLGALDTNCWLAGDDAGGPLVVIDPAGDWPELQAAIAGRPVAEVVLTHGHFDHLEAAAELLASTGAPLSVHALDAPRLTSAEGTGGALFGFDVTAPPATRTLADGDLVVAGALVLAVLHTPGHTQGGICLYAEADGHLFSGDTLFAGSVGRSDFAGGDARALSRSLAEKLAPLADEVVVHPGHGPDTTMGREKRLNPFFPRA